MSRVEMNSDLDIVVAERVMLPALDRALDMLKDSARRSAPDVRVWASMRDGRVRKSHVKADGQAIPANLRFKVPKVNTGDDANDIRLGFDMARAPRDPSLPIGNRINCRCNDVTVPHLLRDSIDRTPITQSGTHLQGSVETRFDRAAESEFGTTEDTPALFMTRALQEVALRLQSGQSR